MRSRLAIILEFLKSSYWFIPALMAVAAIILSIVTVQIDLKTWRWGATITPWIYMRDAEGARAMLSTIIGSIISVISVVFSITIVALQLASSQFGPRVLRNFISDRGNQIALGTFIATFTFNFLVLRTIHHNDDSNDGFVPHLAMTLGMLMTMFSVGMLIYFIHHVSLSIYAPHLVANLGHELISMADSLFPDEHRSNRSDLQSIKQQLEMMSLSARPSQSVLACADGYLQAIDEDELKQIAEDNNLLLKIEYKPGDFIISGCILATVWSQEEREIDDKILEKVRKNFIVGSQRTIVQDIEYAINQLTEVATRSLSPGINDPFTAITCIDWLTSGLRQLCRKELSQPVRLDPRSQLRLLLKQTSFADLLDTAFNQIRIYGCSNAVVAAHLLKALIKLADFCQEDDEEELIYQAKKILRTCQDTLHEETDRDLIEGYYQKLIDKLSNRITR